MQPAKLVFVEGMTGAGKSTTAARIAEWLAAHGELARRYHEMDDDNPIRTRGVDALRARHPHVGRMPDVGPDGLATDPGVYAVEQWGALARRCNAGRETVILESRYIQNSVQPRYLAGAPAEKVHEGFAKICSQVAVASPLLVYLRPTNVRAALLRTLAERDPEWVRWIQHAFGNNGWAARRGLSGEEAVIRFYEEWEALAGELFDRHPGPRLLVRDPQDDWNAALARIYAAVRPTLAPAGGSRAR